MQGLPDLSAAPKQHQAPPQNDPKRTDDLGLSSGLVIDTAPEPLELLNMAHPQNLSDRWFARGKQSGERFEVLFFKDEADLGPLLRELGEKSWGAIRGSYSGLSLLTFPETNPLTSIGSIRATSTSKSQDFKDSVTLVLALGELFEMIHELCDGLVVHADLSTFAFKIDQNQSMEATIVRPELIYDRGKLPQPGSFRGSGFDAPEVTGAITRHVDVRADVYLLGMFAYHLLTGITPTPGTENFAGNLPALRNFDAGVCAGLQRCLQRAISRTPADRYDSVAEFLEVLRGVIDKASERALIGTDKPLSISWAADTRIGHKKMISYPINQDNLYATMDAQTGWGLFAVLDGVSRSKVGSGEMASWIARTTLEREWNLKRQTPIYGRRFEGQTPFPVNLLSKIVDVAHKQVASWTHTLIQHEDANHGDPTLCSTLSAVAIFGDRCAVCNVGDSPIYLARFDDDPWIEPISAEHIHLNTMLRQGIPIPEAFKTPGRQNLTEAIGLCRWSSLSTLPLALNITPTTWSFRLKPGDLLVLCSDGVSNAFGSEAPEVILRHLKQHLEGGRRDKTTLQEAADTLLDGADKRCGRDNMTIVIVAVGEGIAV